MDVLLDSNVFRADLKLKSKNIDILLDYLNKTNSKILLPQIVLEEIQGLFRRLLTEKIVEQENAYEKLIGTLVKTKIVEPIKISIDYEIEAYKQHLADRLNIDLDNVIPYKDEFLTELVERAIHRKKPLDGKGQQFRDGLLWLTILDYTKTTGNREIIFISTNTKDFSNNGKNELDRQLQEEVNTAEVGVKYYRDLSGFAKEHAAKIDFINIDWITKNIKNDHIESIFLSAISSSENSIFEYYCDNFDSNMTPTGHIESTGYIRSSYSRFTVYEMSDGTLLLNLDVDFELEYMIEVETEKEVERESLDYEYNINPVTGEMEMDHVYVPKIILETEIEYEGVNPLIVGSFIVTIKNEIIEHYELNEWDWG